VVWTNGCFDLLHTGHLDLLRNARALGDALIVGLNGDGAVRAAKGPGHPILPVEERQAILEALAAVDLVVVFEETTPEQVLEVIRPDVHCKGDEYGFDEIPERAVVERHGGRVVLLPMTPGHSTSRVIERLQYQR
jgi:rfaE bifunctional protein nucleotidyltransferase chain/domain